MAKENFSTTFYSGRIQELNAELQKYKQRAKIWVLVRLLTFIALALHCYFAFPYSIYAVIAIVVIIVLFIFFIRKSIDNKEQLNYTKLLVEINQNEIQASQHDFSAFNNGEEYIDKNHPFSFDMDLFGEGGCFQIFNRTVTKKGEKLLVDRLLNGHNKRTKNIEAIESLSEHLTWCQEYLAYGKTIDKSKTDIDVSSQAQKEYQFSSITPILFYISPLVAVTSTILTYLDILSGTQFLIIALLIFVPIYFSLKKVNHLMVNLSSISESVNSMQKQLELFEQQEFQSDLLNQYKAQLFINEKNGKEGLNQLVKLIKEIGYRNNILVAVLLNFYLAWDYRMLIHLKKWQSQYGDYIEKWEEIVYALEVLISGACYRYNFKEHTSAPIITDIVSNTISIKDIGHPTIPVWKMVKNDFEMPATEQFTIITGPNMAGKSTFLRSVGFNLMMARAGFHVIASHFEFPDTKLYSSMRTNDNLKNDTSYFHAELLRLRFIVDAIERGEQIFIILDEILKGTNSKDKAEGSAQFLEKLNKMSVKGLIATHDLSLTDLAKKHKSISNQYFDTKIEGDEISFDYCIRKGVAQNMNASFLLKKMRLTD